MEKAKRVDKDKETHTQGVSGRSKARGNKPLRVVTTTADISSYSSTLSVRKWNRKKASWSAFLGVFIPNDNVVLETNLVQSRHESQMDTHLFNAHNRNMKVYKVP